MTFFHLDVSSGHFYLGYFFLTLLLTSSSDSLFHSSSLSFSRFFSLQTSNIIVIHPDVLMDTK